MDTKLLNKLIKELVRVGSFPREIHSLPWEVETEVKKALELVAANSLGINQEVRGLFRVMEKIDPDLFQGFDFEKMEYNYQKVVLIAEFILRNLKKSDPHFCLSTIPGGDVEFLNFHELDPRGLA